MARRTILFIGGGQETADAIAEARALDLGVVVSDRNPNAPAVQNADHFVQASTYDAAVTVDAVLKHCQSNGPIHGVLTIGADVPLTVASVAHRMGLAGIPQHAAELAQDKLAMKVRFREAGIPIPWFAPLPSPQSLHDLVAARGLGHVIKPVDSRGSRGVQRLSAKTDLDAAWHLAASHSLSGRVMAEAYLDGPQVSTESILINGRGFTPGFSDRNYEFLERFAPFFIENGGDLPSTLPEELQHTVKLTAEAAGRALGITTGNVKGDIVVHNGKPHVIELAARASGGHFCTREIPLNTGVNFVRALIQLALGEHVSPEDLLPIHQRPVIQRYAFPKPGRITRIAGIDAAARVEGVSTLLVTARIGDVIPPPMHAGCTAAMVLATGTSTNAAKAAAQSALDHLTIETEAA